MKLSIIKRILEMPEPDSVLLLAIKTLLSDEPVDDSFSINKKALDMIDTARREIKHGNDPAD